ncbi:hypothetical protein BJ138DRAFT_1058484 [Hygrophoropsis aurantiaca]|uniref:Uncharacterized protein n=1 Tax=Hygrophoropsis aurantiaca TaxID=72124 RepID=A0ACB8AKH4_9AGAM|nr:hypothetical protein BJ138DRAFT_1058484 [Hygrophoropsis aurantiaca]
MPIEGSAMSDNSPRQVNNILRNMRGEQYRHERNVRHMPVAIPLSAHTHNNPTLPINLIYPTPDPQDSNEFQAIQTSRRAIWLAGPNPPKSWTSSDTAEKPSGNEMDTASWREAALSILFLPEFSPQGDGQTKPVNLNGIPTLSLLCLRVILKAYPGSEYAQVTPFIPPHLRRDILRDRAIYSPLSEVELYALCLEGHVDGELIVIGPRAVLRSSHFHDTGRFKNDNGENETFPRLISGPPDSSSGEEDSSWDSIGPQEEHPALRTLVLMSTPLPIPTFLVLPPTLTHLALINIPNMIPLARLPTTCPLLAVLDLSYNRWLSVSSKSAAQILKETEWNRLHHLRVLGLRGCHVTPTITAAVNRGRWDDVRIVK